MSPILKAAIAAGNTVIVLFLLFVFFSDESIKNITSDLVWGIILTSALLWGVSCIIASICLILLVYIYELGSKYFSLIIFILVGFIISFEIALILETISSLRYDPNVHKTGYIGEFEKLIYFGIAGSICATASWLSLNKNVAKNPKD
jgi:hypothetical protein